ncbi:hypothetical protein HGRIS_008888 [Hohenbuehelia grisea]|uniref:Uncharacterized protein n=1 Tax=Hohenbuehelia grisea TaxID=104357 RepID=A0ABR3IZF0_9AGAR
MPRIFEASLQSPTLETPIQCYTPHSKNLNMADPAGSTLVVTSSGSPLNRLDWNIKNDILTANGHGDGDKSPGKGVFTGPDFGPLTGVQGGTYTLKMTNVTAQLELKDAKGHAVVVWDGAGTAVHLASTWKGEWSVSALKVTEETK